MRQTALALLAIVTAAVTATAAPPPKYLDVDVNWQQMQALPTIEAQQGADLVAADDPQAFELL